MFLFFKNFIIGWALIFPSTMLAAAECCLQHGDVCGDKCCDGTSFNCGKVQIIFLPPAEIPNPQEPKSSNEPEKTASPPEKWLYTWKNSQTGVLYLSSNLPPWYRNVQIPSSEEYPRVLVFDEYNRLVDDTDSIIAPELKKTQSPLDAAIKQHQVLLTMTKEQVKQAWGEPKLTISSQQGEMWAYASGKNVIFTNGLVSSLEK